MTTIVWQIAVYLLVPLAALELERRYQLFELLNPVVVSYLAGMVMANAPFVSVDTATARMVTEAAIPLAIPLILFPSDVRAWVRRSRSTVVSFISAVVAASVASGLGAWLFRGTTEEFWKVAGMLVGVYTGGTPNLVSIGSALGASEETFVLVNASDVVVSAFYLLFLITIAKEVVGLVLPAFSPVEGKDGGIVEDSGEGFDWREAAPGMAVAFGLSVVIVGVSAGVTYLAAGELLVAGIFLGLTTGGILASFRPEIRELTGSYELGNYLILVFCVAMGARTNFGELAAAGSSIVLYTGFVIYTAILIHLLLAAVFRVDVDTFLITSTAAVFGPAFVPLIAEALDNQAVVLSGLTAGLVGYAIANYLGIGVGYLLAP